MKISKLFNDFFRSEKTGGLILIACTLLSLLLANSRFHEAYSSIWNFEFANHPTTHWINDGLMTIFFLLIGLELEKEFYVGELSVVKNSLLPISAAMGGMLIPAALYIAINYGTKSQAGAGIPMATDIAFALGALALLGNRVHTSLKIFLTVLAVIDDLGAILVIAIFYTDTIEWINLFASLGIFGALIILNRLKVNTLLPYLVGGIGMWYFMLHSGVHATITGVLLAFVIPFRDNKKSPSHALHHFLHKPVTFIILPLFALANTNLTISPQWQHELFQPISLGIFLGLVVGKPLGIFLFSYLSISCKISRLPEGLTLKHILGVGFLGGIGFTMSIFITLLAFHDLALLSQSKMAIMLSSMIAGVIGLIVLKIVLNRNR